MTEEIREGYSIAEWAGSSAVYVATEDGPILVNPGQTALVPSSEAEESGNWRVVEPVKGRARRGQEASGGAGAGGNPPDVHETPEKPGESE